MYAVDDGTDQTVGALRELLLTLHNSPLRFRRSAMTRSRPRHVDSGSVASTTHRSDDLTIMVLDTLPGVLQPAHDHAMNAFIGVFEGCEEQRFWARTATGVESATGRLLEAGEVVALGERAIHAISAPAGVRARAVHVYLGDIYDVERSVFDPTRWSSIR